MAGRPRGGSRAVRKPATSPSSRCPRMRSPVNAKRRSRRDATSSTPSQSNSIGWSQPFAVFSQTSNDGHALNMRDFKGMVTGYWQWHPCDSEQLRSVPRTQPDFWRQSRAVIPLLSIEGARHERHNLEGARGETGLDRAFGHRVDGGLFNRNYPARASVDKRSSVSPAG